MVRRRFGRVVNISTISAQTGLPGQSAYAASKAGVEALTRTVAIEMARRGITSNAVAPGLVTTDFVPEMTDEWAEAVPANRAASPEEVAACVRFLASDDAAYVNGAVIRMDGALTAGIGMLVRREKSGAKRLSVVDK
jgi:3-oxoacyl-[acyl-carrier protein] reductase